MVPHASFPGALRDLVAHGYRPRVVDLGGNSASRHAVPAHRPNARRHLALVALAALGAAALVPSVAAAQPASGVDVIQETFVDKTRPTAANGDCAKISSRTLPTTIYAPAGAEGPSPLIVFAHGLGGTPDAYAELLQHLAASGYVVAAPTFPLSSGDSPCGAVAGDAVNQPEDMSFVIDEVLDASKADSGPLAGLVDPDAIGAAGHSNGGITVYGLVANTALRDKRIGAAAVLAGTAVKYPRGRFDFADAPPLLIVHGTDDSQVAYDRAVDAFNRARGPKGLLTLTGGDHGSPVSPPTFPALTDFFDGYLRDDQAALDRLPNDAVPGVATMQFDEQEGSTTTIPTQPRVARHLKATVSPKKNLSGGQLVTVDWSGYTPGKAINILQCTASNRDMTNSAGCDYTKAALLHPNPTGEGSLQLEIVEGTVGDGICDAQHQGCFILVNNESSTDPRDSVFLDITFAKG